MGRNKVIADGDVLLISTKRVTAKLQKRSDRRALIDVIINNGGRITMGELNNTRGCDCRAQISSLIRTGWIELEEAA